MSISLRPITAANWRVAAHLRVREDQRHFVADNLYSIAESQFGYRDEHEGLWACFAYGVYASDDMVGFSMICKNPGGGRYQGFVARLMIDAAHQGHGHGRAAMQLLLAEFERDLAIRAIGISYELTNAVARALYASLGFVEVEGLIVDGEQVATRAMR